MDLRVLARRFVGIIKIKNINNLIKIKNKKLNIYKLKIKKQL